MGRKENLEFMSRVIPTQLRSRHVGETIERFSSTALVVVTRNADNDRRESVDVCVFNKRSERYLGLIIPFERSKLFYY